MGLIAAYYLINQTRIHPTHTPHHIAIFAQDRPG